MKAKLFETWTFNGTRFLAYTANRGSVFIVDESGGMYGSFFDVAQFRKHQKDNDLRYTTPIGRIQCLSHVIAPE